MSQAVLIAIGIDWDGRRQIMAVEMANRESRSSWKDFFSACAGAALPALSLSSPTITQAFAEPSARSWPKRLPTLLCPLPPQRLDHLPRKADDDCLQELRWLYDRRSIEEARQDLAAWIAKWGSRYPKLVSWVEETIEETLTFYRLPRQHHKHLKSTNMLERFNEEIRW